MSFPQTKKVSKVKALTDRNGALVKNEEGVWCLLIEPERRKVIGVDTTINGTFIIIISFIKSILNCIC